MAKISTKDFILSTFLLDVLVDVVIVFILVLLIRTFLFAPFRVHGPSMCDTFNIFNGECYNGDGEYVLTSRLSIWDFFGWSPTDLDRGDVIIFQAPYNEKGEFYIKRIIGLPGETLKISDGYVYLLNTQGEYDQLEEDYLSIFNLGNTRPHRATEQVFEVPEGEYFVMGDNRTKSSDSRRCFKQLGCDGDSSPYLDLDAIEGEVKLVIFPLSHFRLIRGVDYEL